MSDTLIFYYSCRDNTTAPDFSYWFHTDIQLKVIADNLPDEVVCKQCPSIHWMTNPEFESWKQNHPEKVFLEIPSLFHVPSFGKDFLTTMKIPENCGVLVPVFDFDWVYYIKSDNVCENYIRFSQRQILIENKMTDKEEWLMKHVRPSWETFFQYMNDLDIYQRRMLLGLSKVLGEWKLVGELTKICDWSQAIEEYDVAEMNFFTNMRLPEKTRSYNFLKNLEKCQPCFESRWALLETVGNDTEDTDLSTARESLLKKAILHEQKEEYFPEWCEDMPICRWVRKKMVNEDELYKSEIRLLKTFKEDYKFCWSRYLFSRVIGLVGSESHRLFTQESIHILPKLCDIPDCEKGELLYCKKDPDFVPSSSGLIVFPDNPRWYLVNVRKVNYRILPQGSYVTIKNGQINSVYNGISKNEFYLMDRETLKPVSPIRPMKEDIPGVRENEVAIVGLEDVRLVPGINQDILFYGVTKSYSYSDSIRIITGKYDVERTLFHSTQVIHPPYEENACEKNWVWCGNNRYIYKWHPVEIGSVDPNERLVIDERIISPPYFREFRGSSPAVIWKDYHFFSVHSVAHGENGRKYIHTILIMDLFSKEHKVVAVSMPFCFEDIQIEYNIGLDIHQGKMLFLYSTRDCTSKYVRIPLFFILEKLLFMNKKVETEFKTKIYQNIF